MTTTRSHPRTTPAPADAAPDAHDVAQSGQAGHETAVSDAVDLLRRHNAWRRGADLPPTDPTALGLAIDAVVGALDAPQPPAEAQPVAAQAEQSDRRTFPMGYDSHLHGLVTDNVASALLCCGIEHLPAGVLDTIASEIVRGYHAAPLPPAEAQERKVGCEGDDGLIRAHKESETCDVCATAEAQAQGGGKVWQPMATAPKNGAGILALLPESNFPVGVRYHDGGWHVAWDGSRLGEFDQPHKWMQIPDEDARTAPPSAPVGVEAVREIYGAVIRALAAIVNVNTPDKLFDLDAIPNAPVMEQVMVIRAQMDKLSALAQQPAAVDGADTRRLEWLIANELLVHRLSDTGQWMLTTGDLSPAIDGAEHATAREAIDAGMAADAALAAQPGGGR